MKRIIARLGFVWRMLFLGLVLLIALDLTGIFNPPGGLAWVVSVVAACLVLVVAMSIGPQSSTVNPVEVLPPVRGRWLAMNSPGQEIPSHGVHKLGQLSAVDLIHSTAGPEHVDPTRVSWSLLGDRPEKFSCFGAPVFAVAAGQVISTSDWQRDQRARNSWPSVLWFFTGENILRSIGGTPAVIGNRVVIQHDDGTYAAYAHLKRGSVRVRRGQRIRAGDQLAAVGNTGNSTQPHLHMQLMDRPRFEDAAGIPMVWRGLGLEDVDPAWQKHAKPPAPTALEGMPRNGQIFTAEAQ
ncbi:M23 family metallopeptidase [Nesterenkonia massiliensis]|uniref:M23 family metallopeptidase n=1 Tax=Nesterenkonia massiliensis TaxID=1232429 RepID=A0ABT2HPZ9_9MICC|nr:M23 family metallopeptidase [Nesterenkonia massiliensis]MCT1606771.1 M23 family metallopeptidase [Nesterenkonia massiliensis]